MAAPSANYWVRKLRNSRYRVQYRVHLALSRIFRSRLINGSRRASPAAPDLLRAADELQLVEMRLLQKAIGAES